MSNFGGYRIIDLEDKEITAGGAGVTVPGIYDKIEGTRRACLLSGINIGITGANDTVAFTEYNDAYINPVVSGDDFVFHLYGFKFVVDDDDKVTITKDPSGVAAHQAGAAGTAPTKAEYDALLAALITAGLMAST